MHYSITKINGGLKMLDIDKFIQALKCSWIKRLVSTGNSPWAKLFELSYGPISSIFNYGTNWGIIVNNKLPNKFWKELFSAWNSVDNTMKIRTRTDILSSSLWYNNKLGNDKLYKKNWEENRISVIGDVVNDKLQMLDKEILEEKFGFKILNYLDYFQIRSTVRNYIANIRPKPEQEVLTYRPYIPYHMKTLLNGKQGSKDVFG